MKPIAWKFNDPIEDARWVFDESDLTRIELEGAETIRVKAHDCAECGQECIEYDPRIFMEDYDVALLGGDGRIYCDNCFSLRLINKEGKC